ncbi:MAG TPA: hypothetical protein VLA93_14265 [Pyrinomonadaceae bacterium]|nr:hypothetical protein [Pyrinomonadaceae bacterium]
MTDAEDITENRQTSKDEDIADWRLPIERAVSTIAFSGIAEIPLSISFASEVDFGGNEFRV